MHLANRGNIGAMAMWGHREKLNKPENRARFTNFSDRLGHKNIATNHANHTNPCRVTTGRGLGVAYFTRALKQQSDLSLHHCAIAPDNCFVCIAHLVLNIVSMFSKHSSFSRDRANEPIGFKSKLVTLVSPINCSSTRRAYILVFIGWNA